MRSVQVALLSQYAVLVTLRLAFLLAVVPPPVGVLCGDPWVACQRGAAWIVSGPSQGYHVRNHFWWTWRPLLKSCLLKRGRVSSRVLGPREPRRPSRSLELHACQLDGVQGLSIGTAAVGFRHRFELCKCQVSFCFCTDTRFISIICFAEF